MQSSTWGRGQKLKKSCSRPMRFRHCKHFIAAVELLFLTNPLKPLPFAFADRAQMFCVSRELPKSGLCRSATVSISEKRSCIWQLVWLVNSGVAARLTRASGQKLKVCRQEGDMAGASPGEEHRLLGEMLTQLWGCRIWVQVSAHVVWPPLWRTEQKQKNMYCIYNSIQTLY